MIKIDIKNRTNLTLLAKAYLENLLPKGKEGEVFYDNDDRNEIKSIYFSSEEYYETLIKAFDGKITEMASSNAFTDWLNLYETLITKKKVENVDYGELEHYTLTTKGESIRKINLDFIENKINKKDTFLKNVKRLYEGYEVTYWGNENFVVIKLPFNNNEVFDFDLKPITQLLDIMEKRLTKFNIYRDPSRELTVVRIEIEN